LYEDRKRVQICFYAGGKGNNMGMKKGRSVEKFGYGDYPQPKKESNPRKFDAREKIIHFVELCIDNKVKGKKGRGIRERRSFWVAARR